MAARVSDPVVAGVLAVGAAALVACQALAVGRRNRLAATVVGAVFLVWGLMLAVVGFALIAWFDGHETPEIVGLGAALMAANLFAAITMLRWSGRLVRRSTPLPPPPASAEDD